MTDDEQDIGLLLPFYANGTIGDVDRERVRIALARSPELQEELEDIRALQGIVTSGAKDWEAQAVPASEARLSNLLGRIEEEEAQSVAVAPAPAPVRKSAAPRPVAAPVRERTSLFAWLFQPAWKPAFAATLMVALMQGAMLYQDRQIPADEPGSDDYQTASGQHDGATVPAFSILIRPSDNASWSALKALLEREGLVIVDGPVDGMLQVAAEGEMSEGARRQIIATLSASPLIESAKPAL
ncbi:MAG: hypothetical protein ACK5NN_04710 [Sphingomonadaceae bacterium]